MKAATFADLTRLAVRFRDQRDWKQFHTPKELAISLVVEASELLELMQWKQGRSLAQTVRKKRRQITDELGDCIHSILLLAHDLGLDPAAAFTGKLRKLRRKYPVARCKGKADKYTDLL
jgi:NTP pyrophosphatase (non-canonical NTP hydrolase)